MSNNKEATLKDVKKNLRRILKFENPQSILEGLLAATELCALCLHKNIKIVVVDA